MILVRYDDHGQMGFSIKGDNIVCDIIPNMYAGDIDGIALQTNTEILDKNEKIEELCFKIFDMFKELKSLTE